MKTIINVAYPFAQVKENTPGGAEQVLSAIDSELAKCEMYKSIVIASEGSKVNGMLLSFPPVEGVIDENKKSRIRSSVREAIGYAINKFNPDLIHFHGLDFHDYIPDSGVRILTTLHLPLELYDVDKLNSCTSYYNCVSLWQHSQCKGLVKRLLPYIRNGVCIPSNINRKVNPSFAFSLGRICPEKGYHIAIKAAKRAKVPFMLAGDVFNYAEHIRYYTKKIEPELNSVNCRFIGKIGNLQKNYLYNNARCVIIPSLINETSSLVAMEAMAHGTPVIAHKRGALVELIKNGINGYLVDTVEQMADAILKSDEISSEICFEIARAQCDLKTMTSSYLSLYNEIINNSYDKKI